ncbi:Hypothetical protein POVR1_LOCUS344 [uncultured virus]|nr:Hypothetical protein POVR1_LOCUS344 [uncultured virus]
MGNDIGTKPVPVELDAGYYHKLTGVSYNRLLDRCEKMGKDYEKFDEVMKSYMEITPLMSRSMFRDIIVSYIGFALPSPQAIEVLFKAYQRHLERFPKAKFVDLGAGSGVFCWLLHRAGILKDRLLAIDLPSGKTTHQFQKNYWEITEDSNYHADPDDVLFIGWGCGGGNVIDQYEKDGGKCLIILGELEDGATYPADAFVNRGDWKIEWHEVMGSANMLSPDYLTINTRY